MKMKELAKALGFALLGATAYAQATKPVATPEPGVTREVLFDEKAFRATATIREAGSVEAPGTHPMDVLIVATSEGTADVAVLGKNQGAWKVGKTYFIPRNADHRFANTGKTPIHYVAVSIH